MDPLPLPLPLPPCARRSARPQHAAATAVIWVKDPTQRPEVADKSRYVSITSTAAVTCITLFTVLSMMQMFYLRDAR